MSQGGFGGFGPPPEDRRPPGGGFGDPSNPYAPPGTFHGGPEVASAGAPGPALAWSPTEAVSFGWACVKKDPTGTIAPIFVALLVGAMPGIVFNVIAQIVGEPNLQHVGTLINYVVGIYLAGGITAFSLKVARGQPYQFGDVFGGARWFLPLLGTYVLMGVAIVLGLVLLVVPGIMLMLGFSIVLPVVVDRNLGPVEALKESWRLTRGHKGDIFVMGLLVMLVAMAGLCACGIGLIVVYPIFYLTTAYLYLRLSGQATAAIA